MYRRVLRTDAFDESVSALGDSAEVRNVLDALIRRARTHPESGAPIAGTAARVLRSLPVGGFPALRLIYRHAGDAIYLYHVCRYDVLHAWSRGTA